jgi:hypothetical protein
MTLAVDLEARRLVDLVDRAAADDDWPAAMTARVTSTAPLLVKPDHGKTASISVTLAAGVTVAMNDPVLLLLIPDSNAYICLGKVTAP